MAETGATICHFRYLAAQDGTDEAIRGRRWYVWDIRIRVELDGVCGHNPIQFYSGQLGETEPPEPQGRVEVTGNTVWMWFKGLCKPDAVAEDYMVAFHVEYDLLHLDGWTNVGQRARIIPVAAFRMFQGDPLYTRQERHVLMALLGNYCVLDDYQQGRQPPEQMTIPLHDKWPRPGTVYEEPDDDDETSGCSRHPESNFSDDDYDVGSNHGEGDRAAG